MAGSGEARPGEVWCGESRLAEARCGMVRCGFKRLHFAFPQDQFFLMAHQCRIADSSEP